MVAVGKNDLGCGGILDDVIIGDDVAALVPDEAGTAASGDPLDVEAERIALHRQVGNVDDGGGGGFVQINGRLLVFGEFPGWGNFPGPGV